MSKTSRVKGGLEVLLFIGLDGFIVLPILAFVLTACSGTIQTVELTNTTTPSPINQTRAEIQCEQDVAYYEGIIIITQYYTFLGYGLHEEAYWLLSTSAQTPHGFEKYLEYTRLAFKKVEIVSIQPYCVAVRQQGGQTIQDPSNRKRFVVQIKAWGEGGMSGSRRNGDLQTLFLTLVREDDKWKIDSFATAPLP